MAYDIRAVRTDELDQMLAIMCEAFGLPYAAARDLFFKDPYFDIVRKRVLVCGEEVVSCLTIVDADLWIGNAAIRVGGIAGVATRASHRRRGFASRLLTSTLPVMRELGCPLSGLFPYEFEFYRRLGWERCGTQYRLVTTPRALPHFTEARYVRAAASGDRAQIEALYNSASRHRSGRWLRDARRWDYLRIHVKHTVVYRRDAVEGYAFYETRESGASQVMRILEIVASTSAAARGLIGYLAESDSAELSYTGDWDDLAASGLLEAHSSDD